MWKCSTVMFISWRLAISTDILTFKAGVSYKGGR